MAVPTHEQILAGLRGEKGGAKKTATDFGALKIWPSAPVLTTYKPPAQGPVDFSVWKNLSAPSKPLNIKQQRVFSGQTISAPRPGELREPTTAQKILMNLQESFGEALFGGTKREEFERLTGRRPETLMEQLTTSGLLRDNPLLPFVTRSKQETAELFRNRMMKDGLDEKTASDVAVKFAQLGTVRDPNAQERIYEDLGLSEDQKNTVKKSLAVRMVAQGTGTFFDLFFGTLKGAGPAIQAVIKGLGNEGDALSYLIKIGVPEDIARSRAADAVAANTDETAAALWKAIGNDMRTTSLSAENALARLHGAGRAAEEVPPAIRDSAIERARQLGIELPKAPPTRPTNVPRVAREAAEEVPEAVPLRAEIQRLEATASKTSDDIARGAFKTERELSAARIEVRETAKKVDDLKKQIEEMTTPSGEVPAKLMDDVIETLGELKRIPKGETIKNPKDRLPIIGGVSISRQSLKHIAEKPDNFLGEEVVRNMPKILENPSEVRLSRAGTNGQQRYVAIEYGKGGEATAIVLEKTDDGGLAVVTAFKADPKYLSKMSAAAPKDSSIITSIARGESVSIGKSVKRGKIEVAEPAGKQVEKGAAKEAPTVPKVAPEVKKAVETRFEKYARKDPETESLERLAEQDAGSEYVSRRSMTEDEAVTSNLEQVFADMKGLDAEDLKARFTPEELALAKQHYEFIADSLIDDPARALVKFRSKTTGRLPEVTGKETMKSLTGSGKVVKNSEYGRRGDDIADELGFKSDEEAQEALDKYLARREQASDILKNIREISHNIRLAKQKDNFVGAMQKKLARETAKNLDALKTLVEAAERAGFRKGYSAGNKRYQTLVERLRTRRGRITAIKRAYNLTDKQMREVRGPKDPRFMDEAEFDKYIEETRAKAELEFKRDQEKILIEDLITTKNLQKAENLQRAMEFPPVRDMTLEQLFEYGSILAKTEADDTFLSARMIQTAKNTDLGDIKTIGEGRKKIAEQTGMPYGEGVAGSKLDRWLRDPTLVEKDPLHKLYITEWAAKEADMLTRKYALNRELNKLARAARKSRKKAGLVPGYKETGFQRMQRGAFGRLVPQDDLVVKWLQPFETRYVDGPNGELKKIVTRDPEKRARVEGLMTPEELAYAKSLEKLFAHYYNLAAAEATQRWTLLGVKHTNYRSMYFPHIKRGFFEQWRDNGLIRALGTIWESNRAETKIDFNAFGDRGEVLGYEKWFNNNMVRQGEGEDAGRLLYSQNAAKVALSYFHAFERKLIIDGMTPKIKLLEFLMGKRFETPKSITNPEGTEKIHSVLRRHINEWINNKKGQRVEMAYEQGDRAEAVVDTIRTFIAIQHLGGNIIAQVISGAGGEAMTLSGLGIRGWSRGHARSLTKTGRRLGVDYAGVIGDPPWNALASAANDAGDTLRSGLFYIFGDLAYRARRQMFLGLLTKEEFAAGKISTKRAGEIKLQIGKWHQMPEFRSVAMSTSLAKAATMYTEWALPVLENVYFTMLPRLVKMARASDPEKWKTLYNSAEFKQTFRLVASGGGLAAGAYLLFNPDENDHSTLGYARRKAAQEVGTIFQAMTTWGIPIPFSVFIGYLDQLKNAMGTMITMERYETAGPGHKAGDLKGPPSLFRALVPRGAQQFMPEQETPLETVADIKADIKAAIEAEEMTVSAAKKEYARRIKNLEAKKKDRRFEMSEKDYKKELKRLIVEKDLTVDEGKKELAEYIKEQKERAPERFESDSEASFIEKVGAYAEAIGADPVTAFTYIFQGQAIRRTDNGQIIVRRMSYEASQEVRKERGATQDLILDHTIPLQLGGTNVEGNLKLVPRDEWERYTPVENFLGISLRNGDIGGDTAQKLIRDFKEGRITEQDVYNTVDNMTGGKDIPNDRQSSLVYPQAEKLTTENYEPSVHAHIGERTLDEKKKDLATRAFRLLPQLAGPGQAWLNKVAEDAKERFPFDSLARGELYDVRFVLRAYGGGDGQATIGGKFFNADSDMTEGAREAAVNIAEILKRAEWGFARPTVSFNTQLIGSDDAHKILSHEMLHRLYDLSPMGLEPGLTDETRRENVLVAAGYWLDDWDRLAEKYPVLYEIDRHIVDSGYDTANLYSLGTERFSYLGQRALDGRVDVIPEELRKYYKGVIKF